MSSTIYILFSLFSLLALCGCGDAAGKTAAPDPDPNVFCFYYNWYGTTENDGRNYHWAHKVLGVKGDEFVSGENGDIACNFYPQGGIYSSRDRAVIKRHMEQMASAGIGVVAVTWWNGDDVGNLSLKTIFEEAENCGLKVCFHIEPYRGRTARSVSEDVRLLNSGFGGHPALYKMDGRPVYFIYDSYMIDNGHWSEVLDPGREDSVRSTDADAVYIALLVELEEKEGLRDAGFDGFYTYFAADGFTPASTVGNWSYLNEWSRLNGMIFIPSVGPGYIDTKIRPWNTSTTRDREDGSYYQRMFRGAIGAGADFISITSFNEWHEGTQIEPAEPFSAEAFTYLDYHPLSPDHYLESTADLISEFVKYRNDR